MIFSEVLENRNKDLNLFTKIKGSGIIACSLFSCVGISCLFNNRMHIISLELIILFVWIKLVAHFFSVSLLSLFLIFFVANYGSVASITLKLKIKQNEKFPMLSKFFSGKLQMKPLQFPSHLQKSF